MAAATHGSLHRLRKHADYQRVYKTGRKKYAKTMGYFYTVRATEFPASFSKPTDDPREGARVGLTVPKALGKAVTRNRIKRRLRAAVRTALPLLTGSVDVVLHPRKSAADCAFAALQQEVAIIFRSVQASVSREHAIAGSQPAGKASPRSRSRDHSGASGATA